MKFAGRAIVFLITLSTVVGAVGVILMMAQIIVDVTMRNLFSSSIPGTTALVTNYYMIMVAYLPLALAERMNSHIAVEVVSQLLSNQLRRFLLAVTWAFSAVAAGVVAYALWGEALNAFSYGSFTVEKNTAIPTWPGYFLLPAGFGLYALALTYKLACAVTGSDGVPGLGPDTEQEKDLLAGEV